MSTLYEPCEDCSNETATITFEPYGLGKMAVFRCPNCGISYDTNIEEGEEG